MITLRDVLVGLRGTLAEWLRLRWTDLHFSQARTTLLVFAVLLAISLLMLLARGLRSREAGRTHIGLPAILPAMRRSYLPAMRHAAFLLFLLGMPFFAVALADPQALVHAG